MKNIPANPTFLATIVLLLALGETVPISAQSLQLGVMYSCDDMGRGFKVYSCSGTESAATCQIQPFIGAQSGPRRTLPRTQVLAFTRSCRPLQPGEALPAPSAGASKTAAANGIRVGDEVEVVTGFGWTPAKVLAINGNSYRVLANGVQVTKDYPSEVRRVGAATAQDHASGQYRLGDRVQVNYQGRWMDGKIVTELGSEYQVDMGGRTVWANPQTLRPGAAAPPTVAPKAGVPPKPGLISCAGKIEGRYATTGNFGSFTITFRSGKATMTDVGGNDEVFECWMSGEKIYLHEPGNSNLDMPIDINDDGTLQTPLGEIKKKGK